MMKRAAFTMVAACSTPARAPISATAATAVAAAPLSATIESTGTAERITVTPPGIVFEVSSSNAGVSYTGAKLAAVRECTGEWDREFAEVANAALPFDRLAVHVGSEAFCDGHLYIDMHVRAYVIDARPEAVVRAIGERGGVVARRLTSEARIRDKPVPSKWEPRVELPGFAHVGLSYARWYGDYGGTAHLDAFVRGVGDQTFALLIMWTSSPVYEADGVRIDPIANIVLSVR
ncbi:MAG TPA: hypothetical protein VNO30_17565 [Kofleriaceae bacterium]|nr:hypothetical protein [Kofleriaceae bacterium]